MQVYCCVETNSAEAEFLREAVAPDRLCLGRCLNSVEPPNDFLASDIAFGGPPRGWVAAHPGLRWLQTDSVGVEEYLELDHHRPGLIITNLAGFFADPVAESVLASILALARGIEESSRLKQDRRWRGDALRPELWLLRDRRVVLFGRGAIGERLQRLLLPFGCQVTKFGSDWSSEALDRALARADVVACAVPDTPQTRGVFDRRRIALLQCTAIFVNVGRGTVVDEIALAEALGDGCLAGAALDVTIDEPLPAAHPFWACPNLILTQHSAGGSKSEIKQMIRFFADNLERFRHGAELENVVDFKRGH